MSTHAKLSASGSHRWMACPASIRMDEELVKLGAGRQSSEFAAEGTAAHAIADKCLSTGVQAKHFEDTVIEADGYEFAVDSKMVDAVQLYIDYVLSLKGNLLVEQRVDFSQWVPEGYGTSDAIVIGSGKEAGICSVVDLKYGKGVRVDAENNPQALLYALGVFNQFGYIYEIDTFRLVIVQPRLDHVSEWLISKTDLLAWADEQVAPAAKLALSPDAPFNPGEKQCRFCGAKAICKALADECLKTAIADFDTGELVNVELLTNPELGELLPKLDMITNWAKSVEAHAQSELEHGREVPGYKLVEGRSIRKWRDETAAEEALRRVSKLKVADIFIQKLVSPTQAEKLLGKTHKLLGEHVIKPTGKPTLALQSDKRQALPPPAVADFAEAA